MKKVDTIIISGAGDGLGKALAIECAKKYKVICISKSKNVFQTLDMIKDISPNSKAYQCDISELEETSETLSKLNLSNQNCAFLLCAGQLGEQGGILSSDLSNWSKVYQTNVIGNINIVKCFLNNIKETKFSKIFFFAGGGSAYGYPIFSSYSLSKTAVVRAAENLHLELENLGEIISLAIAPGALKTKMLDKVLEAGAEIKTTVPIDETVNFVIKLLEKDIKKLSGKFIHVRDDIDDFLINDYKDDLWKLRRNE